MAAQRSADPAHTSRPTPTGAYARLERTFGRAGSLHAVYEILHWDTSTVMPPGGAESRGEQLATLEGLRHEIMTGPSVGDDLAEARAQAESGALDGWQQANLAEMTRLWLHASAVPGDLVEAHARARARCEHRWRTARPASDLAAVAPLLTEVLRLTREMAEIKAGALGCTPYEALADEYEPGAREARLDEVFGALEGFLPSLTEAALERQARAGEPQRARGPFSIAAQEALGRKVMSAIGFDFAHGRLDVSVHPFCGGTPDDVRITTRYDEADFARGLMGVMHETGHAMYERGLPAAWRNQPAGRARGMAVHESQSLLVEMQAGRSREVVGWLSGLLRESFGADDSAFEPENLYRLSTRVSRGLIRVDADELTYPAHVIFRYRLEKALLSGDLTVEDLPGAWNESMQRLIGVVPPDHRDGCLQDIHWMEGLIGYFPTYTLGAMTAAQLFDAACRADSDITPSLARGEFAPLMAWLRENVHQWGSRWSTDELLTRATGRPLDVAVFRLHLERRYLES